MTDAEQRAAMQVIQNHPDLQMTDKDGIGINNFGDDTHLPKDEKHKIPVPNKQFVDTIRAIIRAKNFMPGQHVTGNWAVSDGDLIGGDTGGKSYRSVIRGNGAEAKERAISASVSPKIEKVLKDITREQGQPDPF